MKRPSFTLLELLLVLALISAISSLGVAGYKRQYERSRFKSGVVGIQIDLNRTRLLAMRSGQSYIFRFVPGTGFYEIAPLETLQEAIYRMTDDASSQSDALGGSLYSDDEAAFATSLNPYSFDATNEFGVESASDDLFSRENVLADLEQAGRAPSNGVVGANASPLGGSLTGAGAYGSEMGGDVGYLSGVASDGLGSGGQFALDATERGASEHARRRVLRAEALRLLARYQEALNLFAAALKENPKDVAATRGIAQILSLQSDKKALERALSYWSDVADLVPDGSKEWWDAKESTLDVYRRLGNKEQAQKMTSVLWLTRSDPSDPSRKRRWEKIVQEMK